MISGAHVMIFTRDEDADRAFLRDVLEIPCIDRRRRLADLQAAAGRAGRPRRREQ